ncbi:MAG: hypothetical protein OEZ21_03835 [Candidatus Bathyarchaeota archaeon]|nr:hypothetical protein [Candidatus Bathyarchaeota archaeon]MDH5746072.1 hypothetical protein [Candidatus Bathyarchaeota archaeon]
MAANKKILKALKSAITYVDNSMPAMDKKDENSLADSIWHVAAELEYVLFLFSITVRDKVDKSKWKLNPKLKKVELGPTLVTVQDLLNEAEKCTKNEKLLAAYKSAYIARHYIVKVQKEFARNKREALKKK